MLSCSETLKAIPIVYLRQFLSYYLRLFLDKLIYYFLFSGKIFTAYINWNSYFWCFCSENIEILMHLLQVLLKHFHKFYLKQFYRHSNSHNLCIDFPVFFITSCNFFAVQ